MSLPHALGRLRSVLDRYAGRYRERTGSSSLADYLNTQQTGDDEELLTEPILGDILAEVLGFPTAAYFPQLSKAGAKPDFTPTDLVAHPFVLDAKSSAISNLGAHEPQIRRYIDQRGLSTGVLFNLREVRTYRRGTSGHERDLSFPTLPLWQLSRGEALPTVELERFEAFVEQFHYRALDMPERIAQIRRTEPWRLREARGEPVRIDVEYLVDRLRSLSRLLAEDAAARQDELDRELRFKPELEAGLVAELKTLALDLAPGTAEGDLPDTIAGFRSGSELATRVWRQYLLRVSQLALTRILLYRSWEDAGFVTERLYNGGFGQVYERLGRSVSGVLAEAFSAGRDRYPWLYAGSSTYDWYRPSDFALVETLYTLLPVPLGKLDADVLGGLYESYVDEIDRDRLGQFYTPRSVVRFMLDRAGFSGPSGVFDVAGDERRPRTMLDFATGSGGFLVEAARRVVDEVIEGDVQDVLDGLAVVVRGLHGCEISPFPYYLTEVNLLLQVSRLLGRLRQEGAPGPRELTLGVVHEDTLATRRGPDTSLQGIDASARADRAELEDRRFGLVPLDPAKGAAYERMSRVGDFDLVVGNPPYVFESGNRVLFERLRKLPGWRDTYRGKGDYLYYFLLLAAERLRPGGRLAVITPAGWMNAGAAAWLRERLASTLQLDELFLFGGYRVFAPEQDDSRDHRRAQAPTVETAILLATGGAAPGGHQLKVTVLEDERATARALHPGEVRATPGRNELLAEMSRRADAGRRGRRGGILVHGLTQAELRHEEPWPIKVRAEDLAARVVAHLDRSLARDAGVEPLGERWHIFQGIQTGADAYSARIQRRLSREDRDALAAAGRVTGEPIMELPPGAESQAPWRDAPELLARSVEPRAILYGALDEDDYTNLVLIGRGDDVPQAVQDALEPWRRVLATRAEFVRNARRRWFETAWPRDADQLRAPKVIALYRTDRGRFAIDESGAWQPSIKTTLCTPKTDDLSVTYLGGLLNSELLDLWYAVRGKTPWHVRRNYEPKPMARIPYRHVETGHATEAHSQPDLRAAASDTSLADDATDGERARALENTVRLLAANRRALLPYRSIAPPLAATVKDPWRTHPPAIHPGRLIATLPASATVSLRLDPTLTVDLEGDGALGRTVMEGDRLRFVHGRRTTAMVDGPADRLELVRSLLSARPGLLADDLRRLLLPKKLGDFERLMNERAAAIDALLVEGRDLVERAERLVCRLYRLPRELEDEVVAHAVARAARSAPPGEDDGS